MSIDAHRIVARQQVEVKMFKKQAEVVDEKVKATRFECGLYSNIPTYCTVTAIVELMPPVPEIVTV